MNPNTYKFALSVISNPDNPIDVKIHGVHYKFVQPDKNGDCEVTLPSDIQANLIAGTLTVDETRGETGDVTELNILPFPVDIPESQRGPRPDAEPDAD